MKTFTQLEVAQLVQKALKEVGYTHTEIMETAVWPEDEQPTYLKTLSRVNNSYPKQPLGLWLKTNVYKDEEEHKEKIPHWKDES